MRRLRLVPPRRRPVESVCDAHDWPAIDAAMSAAGWPVVEQRDPERVNGGSVNRDSVCENVQGDCK